jgi:hydroxymethylpyrimidine kinase/phosphomethylpyrimidine kinase/thiamine-phosphate diphosphorylase
MRPIVWTIAGSDSGGGAGIQADLHTFAQFKVHGCCVITAITAQNSHQTLAIKFTPAQSIRQQIMALHQDLPPAAIKIGMPGNKQAITEIAHFLSQIAVPVIADPVIKTSHNYRLLPRSAQKYYIENLLPHVHIFTPNLPEVELLLKRTLQSPADIEKAALELLQLGPRYIIIKGGHAAGTNCDDFCTDGNLGFWLSLPRQENHNTHGTGCVFSASITACLALGSTLQDAITVAKSYVTQGIQQAKPLGKGPGPVTHTFWPGSKKNFPTLTTYHPAKLNLNRRFPDCGSSPLGIYPIVADLEQLQHFLALGITTIQLRIKEPTDDLANQIQQAVQLAKQYQARLFINDHWQLAIDAQAYGIHLGQADLITAEVTKIYTAGMRLGISTHNYAELAVAHAIKPSYIGVGPIFATTSKTITTPPLGYTAIRRWRQLIDYPIVAIGGIKLEHVPQLIAEGAAGIATISGLTHANAETISQWLQSWTQHYDCEAANNAL